VNGLQPRPLSLRQILSSVRKDTLHGQVSLSRSRPENQWDFTRRVLFFFQHIPLPC
jgi:hypothetical protein